DYVVAKRTVKPDLTRETTYTNVSGAYRLYGYLYYGKKVKIDSLKTVNIGPYVSTTFTRSINFNNDVQYTNLMKSVAPGFSARFTWKDVLELTPYYAISFTNNDYSLPALKRESLVTHSANFNTVAYFSKKLVWRNDIRFSYNPNISD